MCCEHPVLNRRGLLIGFAGTAGAALSGCVPGGLGGGGFNLISPQQEAQLGLDTWQQIRSQRPASRNRGYQQGLNQVGSRIVSAVGGNPGAWEFVVFQGDEANAFAVPGNRVGVFEGMFDAVEDDPQLATVVAHEIAHVRAHHAAERVSADMASQLGVQVLGAVLQAGDVGSAAEIAGLVGAGVGYGVIMPFSRSQELEADTLGMQMMAAAGYNPEAALVFWQRMSQRGGRAQAPEFLSTHPADGRRIQALQAQLPEAMEIYLRA